MSSRYSFQNKMSEPRAESRKAGPNPAIVLGIGAGAGLALALVPLLVPTLAQSLSGAAPHAYWYISRASAFVAFGLIWMSMLAGLGITSKLARVWPGMMSSLELHRYTALLGLGFGVLHALVLLGDRYIGYTLGQVLVPFMGGSYKPEWVGFGQLALYMLGVVALSIYLRDRIGTRAWRMIHMLTFGLFVMVLVHGLQSGTDSHDWWAIALYTVSAASVLFGSIYRLIAHRIGHRKESLAASGLVAVGTGRNQWSEAADRGISPP